MNRKLVTILILGTITRLGFLSNPLWNDERVTIQFLRAYDSWGLLTQLPARQPHTPLYYLVIDPLGNVLYGRLVSLVAGVLVIYVTWVLARRLTNEHTAALSASLVALAPPLVLQSVWLRMYSILTLLFVCSVLVFLSGDRIKWIVIMTALVWIHPFGSFILVAYLAYMWFHDIRRFFEWPTIPSLAVVPVFFLLVAKITHVGDVGTAGLIHELDPSVYSVTGLYGALLFGRIYTTYQLGVCLFVLFAVLLVIHSRELPPELAYLLTIPVLVTIVLSVGVRPIYQLKYLAFLTPLVAVYLAAFLTQLEKKQRLIIAFGLALAYLIAYSGMIASRSPWIGLRAIS